MLGAVSLPSEFSPYESFDPICSKREVFVFPDADDRPARPHEASVGVPIPSDISVDLGSPPNGVVRRTRPVNGAVVPETSIDEYRDAGTGEDDVDGAAASFDEPSMNAEPQSASM